MRVHYKPFVRWLWLLEILTGAYALAQPVLQRWLGDRAVLASITSSPTLTIVCTIAFICLPSLMIGFSIPLFSAFVKERDPTGLAFQGIYIAYNLGALLIAELGSTEGAASPLGTGIFALTALAGVYAIWFSLGRLQPAEGSLPAEPLDEDPGMD